MMPAGSKGDDGHSGEVRAKMESFWKGYSHNTDNFGMTLDEQAEELTKEEVPEFLSYLPDLTGMDVLELGAGVGRYTGKLAEKSQSVLALDFMESFVKENKERHSHLPNVTISQEDVTKLQLEPNSYDLVFTNWLLMYLSREEVSDLLNRVLHWLRPGGYIFMRESCFHKAGNNFPFGNPTIYRTPKDYIDIFTAVEQTKPESYSFQIISQRSVKTYIKYKGHRNQLCWLLQKSQDGENPHQGFKSFQEFLDNKQCTRISILRYERIIGQQYLSVGGKELTEEFVKMVNLKKDEYVLDVGCGLGGSTTTMAQDYGAQVLGIDLSSNMISMVLERLNEISIPGCMQFQFEICDVTKRDFSEGSFDVVHSRDAIIYIQDKKALFGSFLRWLKPGGRLVISDYCCSDNRLSDTFKAHVAEYGYTLQSPEAYGQMIADVGFVNVKVEDRTAQYECILKSELECFERSKEEFCEEFSLEAYNDIVSEWNEKLRWAEKGDQKWAVLYAERSKEAPQHCKPMDCIP